MNKKEQLLYLTKLEIEDIKCPKLRGIYALWKGNTASISFYFNGEITDEERELASDACAEIIANFPDSLLEENYIRLDFPKPLPKDSLILS